jgi:aspartyl-tRNA(Asn)/glutamyl-tRNA(Gln) amidotransferase subunit A
MVELAGGLGYRYAGASVSGPGRNPWDTTRWTGGSSSGAGGAVAAGLVTFAIGTETWGSILCPSAFCGVTGIRPTYGRVSRAGAMVCSWTFDKLGPLARSANDCRLVLQVIAGQDPDDPSSANEALRLDLRDAKTIGQVRAALVNLDFTGGEPQVKSAFEAAVSELRLAGVKFEEAKMPAFPQPRWRAFSFPPRRSRRSSRSSRPARSTSCSTSSRRTSRRSTPRSRAPTS